MLLEGEDGYRLSELEDRESTKRSKPLRARPEPAQVVHAREPAATALMARLQKWVEGGRYAELFDNVEDTLTFERLQVFDFDAMRAYPR